MEFADNDVQRFVQAQGGGVYEEALAELRDGCKLGHWMWFVFPQVRGLGFSPMADYFGIGSWEEAEAYVADEVLGPRLVEAAEALLGLEGSDPVAVLGSIDALKLRSSMTLFEQVSDNPAFPTILDRYYQGERDPMTLKIVESFPVGRAATRAEELNLDEELAKLGISIEDAEPIPLAELKDQAYRERWEERGLL